jgi:hypothetical protein
MWCRAARGAPTLVGRVAAENDSAMSARPWSRPSAKLPPGRPAFPEIQKHPLAGLVAQEYSAVRNDVQVALSSQVSILSFGAAAVGLSAAAAAAFWDRVWWLAATMLIVVVPGVCFLVLAVYAGEQVRQMRAGLFLNVLEECVNLTAGGRVLTFEHWDIRSGALDVDRYNRRAIMSIYTLFILVFTIAGYVKLISTEVLEVWAIVLLILINVMVSAMVASWVHNLCVLAVRYRRLYFPPLE